MRRRPSGTELRIVFGGPTILRFGEPPLSGDGGRGVDQSSEARGLPARGAHGLASREGGAEGRAVGFVFGRGESLSEGWQGGDQGFGVCDLPVGIGESVFEAREGR